MREKHLRLVVTFASAADAMALERHCARQGLPGRIIPVPREITAGCGLAWSAPPEAEGTIRRAAEEAGVTPQGYTRLMIA